MSAQLKLAMKEGAGSGAWAERGSSLWDLFSSIATDLAAIRTAFLAHKHSFDGSQGTDAITGTPVTGSTSGTATGGTASALTIGTTQET